MRLVVDRKLMCFSSGGSVLASQEQSLEGSRQVCFN